jgi:outer membrane receptor protein involved in Fe transport
MKQRILVTSILMGLVASLNMNPALAQSSGDQDSSKKKDTLGTVTVTGSLIPQAQIETASPTITITSADIQKQGFGTVYDALKALPIANGGVQGNQSAGGFTQGAQTISLFGLPASYTLILLNGKPMTSYPLAYNGSSSITDLSNIPVNMIDHIDIVPGGNSAIYGSSAIAGVVNIVLKEKMSGVDLDYRVGGYSDGGGQNQRLQLSGGGTWGNLDGMFSLELLNQEPIYASQRSTTRSLFSNPSLNGKAPDPSRSFLILDVLAGNKYEDPGAATCAPLSYLFNNTTTYATRSTGAGHYCGTTGQYQSTSLLNGTKAGNAYTNLVYHINDTTEAYTQILFSSSAPKFNVGGSYQFWESNENFLVPNTGYIWNQDNNKLELWQHILAPEEYGGADAGGAETEYTRSINASIGLRGSIGGGDWNYDLYYNRSQTNITDSYRHFSKSAIDNYYLGPQMGTYYGYPVYSPNRANFYKAITPAIFDQLTQRIDNRSVAWNQTANLTVTNADLFTLPAGAVGAAATIQAGQEQLHQALPPFIASGDALGLTGSEASGSRKSYGIGAEFRVPVVSMLTADVSGRYDQFQSQGDSQGKFTYKLGLEFRPLDTLLFRADYATAFRAPDLRDLYNTTGYFTSVTDYYLCRQAGFGPGTYPSCADYNDQVSGFAGKSQHLDNVTAKTFSYGFVYTPLDKLTFKVDYQRASIKNEIQQISLDQVLQNEADCLIGHTVGGQTIDPNSPSCKLYESLITRQSSTATIGANKLLSVTTYPINESSEYESGLIASGNYAFDMGRYGTLAIDANYYVEFKHTIQQFAGDPIIDVYHDPRYTDWKSTLNGSLTWNIGNFSTTVLAQRYGSIPNYGQTGRLPPWMIYNGSVSYSFDSDAVLSVRANNIFNSKPPVDRTQSSFPYYNTYNYNPYGRAIWAEFAFHFGGKKG